MLTLCDLGGPTLYRPRLGFSYVLQRLWDPGGVRSTPNVPIDQSRTLSPSRYPYASHKGHLVNLTNTFHMKLNIFYSWEYY